MLDRDLVPYLDTLLRAILAAETLSESKPGVDEYRQAVTLLKGKLSKLLKPK
jgi:molecular chaperone GrpE (heat shock protein)